MSHIQYPLGVPSHEKTTLPLTIALGRNRQDMNFKNTTATLADLIEMLSTFQVGPKDGLCILQGELVAGQRIAKNVVRNFLMILDVDTGASVQEVGTKIAESGLFALVWTTHSFGKTTTEIPEEQFLRWAKKNGKPVAQDDAALHEQLCSYLSDEKRYHSTITTTSNYLGRALVEGGMKYVIKHVPMPKLRVMFVLKEPFDFTKGASQRVRIDEWKEAYTKVSSWLDIAVDSSCVDPSRLMYTPRVPEDAQFGEDNHEILLFDGDFLDLETVPASGVDWIKNFTDLGAEEDRPNHAFVTKGLTGFAKRCPDFDIIGFMHAVFPDDLRGEGADPDKSEWACPNEESHTVQKADDRGFFVATNGEHWHAQCLHDGCKAASRDDRLWYLDMLCQKAGITDAVELEAWSASAQSAQQEASEASNAAGSTDKIHDLVDGLNKDSRTEDINSVLKVLAMVEDQLTREALLSIAQKNTGKKIPLGVMRKQLELLGKDQRKALGVVSTDDSPDTRPKAPEDPEKAKDVWSHWDYKKQLAATRAIIRKANAKEPELFITPEGRLTLVDITPRGAKMIDADADTFAPYLIEHVEYKSLDPLTQMPVGERPPQALIRDIVKKRNAEWPVIEKVVHTPIVSPTGIQIEKRGYIAELNLYLDPTLEYLPLPAVVTDDDVIRAVDTLLEPIRDFPFSDAFSGEDDLEIMSDEVDDDGHPYPNMERGRSSRAHALAFIIEPMVRHFIDGSCPAYHIDKPAPGTGAGYLADVAFIINTGERAIAQTMSYSNEEFRKAITASLRQGDPILFIDNINRKVDSGDLAAALTGGTWQDRILGESNVTKIPIRNTWVMAGNNLSFSGELMRRNVPIRLDANSPNPARDRPRTTFKYNPLQNYLKDNRAKFVYAINVLVKNWVDRGATWGDLTFNSFDSWTGVMSGIFRDAGIPGLLENVDDYIQNKNVDDDTKGQFAVLLFERFKLDHFSKVEAFQAFNGQGFGATVELPVKVDANNETASINNLRQWLMQYMVGNTFFVGPEDAQFTVKLVAHRTGADRTGFKFIELKT